MRLLLTSNIGGIKKENGQKTPINFFEDNNFFKKYEEKYKRL